MSFAGSRPGEFPFLASFEHVHLDGGEVHGADFVARLVLPVLLFGFLLLLLGLRWGIEVTQDNNA